MPGTPNLVVDQRVHLNYELLRRAVQDASQGLMQTEAQSLVLAEVRTCRAQIASPLDPEADRPPNPTDRARFAGREEVTITMPPNSVTVGNDVPTEIRLGPDLIAVAFALADELNLNEIDTAVLLSNARNRALMRPDRDVVAAAKELFAVYRRHSTLYLQEILRAGLLAPHSAPTHDDTFISALMRERDLLVAEHNVFNNVANRIRTAWKAQAQQVQSTQYDSRAHLQPGELLLLAETIFLLAYTVQLSKDEAVLLRVLLTEAEQIYSDLVLRERAHLRPSRAFGAPPDALDNITASTELLPPVIVEAESVRNLFLVAWMCALDRSRYRDTYDPRTGRCGVNLLLKDPSFFPHTFNIPKLESEDAQHDPICNLPKAIAAAELCGAIFRLAVAEPDEHECVTSFVRLCAYNEALPFLTDSLSSWIEVRAGSMSPDADLYADVLEDLANDIAEAPHVLSPLLQFVIHEVQHAAATVAYGTVDAFNKGPPMASATGTGMHSLPNSTPVARRARPSSMSVTPQTSATVRRLSMSVATPRGRPPLPPPSGRPSGRPTSLRDGFAMAQAVSRFPQPREDLESSDHNAISDGSPRIPTENVLSSLARFIARAVALAPSKLSSPSASGGLRYWSSVGPSNWGFIQRIGDAVMDLWDLAMRNPYFAGGVGYAFRQALNGYLELLTSTCMKHESAAHALAALRFLVEGGHSVVSLERLLGGLSIINSRLGAVVNEHEAQVDEADCEVLRGIVNIISQAADAVRDHGGILTALGERGKELAINVGALAIHNVPVELKQALIRCLGALGDQRPIATFLENVAKDKAAPLRHYLRSADAQSGEFDVTIRVLELASMATSWNEDEIPDSALEAVVIWFAIEEVLMYWSRRKYSHEVHRWHIVHAAGTLIRDLVYNDLSSSRSHRILAHLLAPAPGTGAASFAFKTLVSTSGLVRAGHDHANPNTMDPMVANLYRVSGRASLTLAIEQGLGEPYRMMQEAVRTSSRILSLLLEVNPGRMSIPGVSVVPAAELLNGELSSIAAATALVFSPDSFLPRIGRAGYSGSVCSAVLAMLSRAARGSENVAALFWKSRNAGDFYAAEFRTSLGNIIAQCDPMAEADGSRSNERGVQKFTISCKDYPDPPLMHSALALVEACLGRDGGNKPGVYLLGLNLDAKDRYESTQYGVLGALIQLIAGPTNGDESIDSMSRATAATFLERLAANTVRSTSLAVLEHLKEIGSSSDLVRGSGFGDEMLFRVMDAFQNFESHSMSANVNWAALGALVSSCLSLSALQVRVFPEYEREKCVQRGIHENGRAATSNFTFNRGDSMRLPPSPLDLLRLLHTMANSGGDLQTVSDAFRNWYLLLGIRLSVHGVNEGCCSVPLLFEVSNVILEATAQSGAGNSFSSAIKNGGGEVAGATVLSCLERIRLCDKVNTSRSEDFVSDAQCAVLLNGIIRSLAEMTGIGMNAARGRTSLYSALLICDQIAKKHQAEDVIRQEFGRRVGQRSGTEILINAACADAIGGARAGTKCAGLAATCLATRMDGVHAVTALEGQGRFRKVIQVCLRDPKVQSMICEACWSGTDLGDRSYTSAQQAAVAVAGAVVGVIHAAAASGHGMRLLTECGCVEAIALLLPCVFYRRANSQMGVHADMRSSHRISLEVTRTRARKGSADQRRIMLNSLTGALAAAVACAGGAADNGGAFIIGEGGDVFVELLRNINLPSCVELETLTSIGLMMSRLPDEVVMGSESGTNVCGWLASVLGTIVPSPGGMLQIGSSGSDLSAGVACREPDSVREARRVGIMHPECGSLYERDILVARASCAQSLFAALRGTKRALRLFSPELESEVEIPSDAAPVGNARAKGSLADVARICKMMIREAERAAEESIQIDSKLGGDGGASFATLRLNDLADYYFEEYGIERESLTAGTAMECLKEASAASKRHGAVCISVFESGLFVLREFICAAKDIVRGRFNHTDRGLSFSTAMDAETPQSNVAQNNSNELLSIVEAEHLLKKCKKTVLPLCTEIEGLADSVWCGKSSSFSKQVCRQIRTACSTDTSASNVNASSGKRLSVRWT